MPKRRTTKKPPFYFEELNSWDKGAIGLYGLASIVFIIHNYFGANEYKREFLMLYTISPQICSYAFNYGSLRNLKSFFIWYGFGTLHIIFYFLLRNNDVYGGASGTLLNTVILLLIYQVLRMISLKVQHQELAVPTRSGKDLLDNRDITFLDFVLIVVYMGCFLGLTVLAVSVK